MASQTFTNSYKELIDKYHTYDDYFNGIELFYDELAWDKAVSLNTKISYESYLLEYSIGTYSKEAKKIIEAIVDDQNAWDETKRIDTEKSYENYLGSFINGKYINDAVKRLDILVEDRNKYETAKNQDSKESYDKYLKNNTNGKFIRVASQRQLEIINDKNSWENAKRLNTQDIYKSYLKEHKEGFFVKEAKQKIDEIGKDQNNWDKALKLNTQDSYSEYLSQYKNGIHHREAKDKINDFNGWSTSLITNTKSSYERYIINHQNGMFKKEASLKLKEIADDEKAWMNAVKDNTKILYSKYINEFTNSLYVKEAKQKIDEIELDESDWENAIKNDTQLSYQKYLTKHPKGLFCKNAKLKIDDFLAKEQDIKEEDKLWKESIRSNSISSYEKYLNIYVNGIYKVEAQEKIEILIVEKKVWENAKKVNILNLYTKYLKDYPKGKFVSQAMSKREILNELIDENKMWDKTQSLDTKNAYTQYLSKYSNGKHREEAQNILDKLIAKEQNNEKIAKLKKMDEIAWQEASSNNSQASYRKYLKKFPAGKYKIKAKALFEELTELLLWKRANYEKRQDSPNGLKYIKDLNDYIKKTKTSENIAEAKEIIKRLEKEDLIYGLIGLGFLASVIGLIIFFIFFHVRDTTFYFHPNSAEVYVNGDRVWNLNSGGEYELPRKYNTIKVKAKGYGTQELTAKEGKKSLSFNLNKGYFYKFYIKSFNNKYLAINQIISLDGIEIKKVSKNEYKLDNRLTNKDSSKFIISFDKSDGQLPLEINLYNKIGDIELKLDKSHDIHSEAMNYFYEKKYKFSLKLFELINEDKRVFFYLGYLYKINKDYYKSVAYYKKGCTNNNSSSCTNLGIAYENGSGVSQSDEKAFKYYKKSADLGGYYGTCYTANAYFKGKGVYQSTSKAKEYLSKGFPNTTFCNDLKKKLGAK